MLLKLFCLDCEEPFHGSPDDNCPFCGSENVMNDNEDFYDGDWDDGHYEGDMISRGNEDV